MAAGERKAEEEGAARSTANSKASAVDCRQYYHLGMDYGDIEDDDEDEGNFEVKASSPTEAGSSNLAQELAEAAAKDVDKNADLPRECRFFQPDTPEPPGNVKGGDVVIVSEPRGGGGGGGSNVTKNLVLRKVAGSIHQQADLGAGGLLPCGVACGNCAIA